MSYYNNRSNSGNSNQLRDLKGSPQQLNVKKTRNVSSSASSNMAPATPRMMRLASNPQNISDEYTINTNFQSSQSQHAATPNPDLLPGVEFGSSSQQQRPQHYYHYQQSAPHQQQQQQHATPPMPSTPKRSSQPPSGSHVPPNTAAAAFHRRSIGDWEFMKTIGSGSMGKVKLAKHRITNEVCAVKVVTRAAKVWQRQHQNDPPPADQHEIATRKKEFDKELGRDKRTIREAALGKILYHPFICRLYEMYPMSNHYYMLFEYVQGGQMLDYIVSHGSLKESQARKFCRGIASALDYCHSNNIVHRDLKIENIMINTQGEIKIIDFGLSNLFDREHLLKTYCGSLYFAAPELLSAQPYVGPEVDIWSFGVVLYVLTCGKVPFDDKSVNTLHEKIKKGNVEYPSTLTPECVSLLRRMILVNSNLRATIKEVINHPWMNKGYQGIVSNYLPPRYPIDLPLDQEVIKAIVDLDLAPSIESVNSELTKIIKSQSYQLSVSNWYAKKNRQVYDLKLPDPTRGIHPILSIYYLVDEMSNRKKAKLESIEKQQQIQKEQQHQQIQKHQYVTPQLQQSSVFPASSPQPSVPHESSNRIVTQPVPIQYQHNNSDNSDPFADQISPVVNIKPPQAAHTSPHQSSATPHTFNKPSLIIETDDNKSNIQPSQQSPVEQSFGNSILRKLSIKKDSNDVRRVGSVKVTSKEKQQHLTPISKNYQQQQQSQIHSQSTHRHQRAASAYTTSTFATDKLPPIPTSFNKSNYNENGDNDDQSQPVRYHPNARAKSVGHARKQSLNLPTKASYQNNDAPPLPQMNINSQQMNHSTTGGNEFFDEEDDVNQNARFNSQNVFKQTRKLSEKEIIEQYQRASPGSMPSIEYPKTLFLKGFFSVQTTSTKPLPVIRYGIISVLPQLGVQFVEVKGGFICVHYPSIVDSSSPIREESPSLGSPIKNIKYHTPTDETATEDEGDDGENEDDDENDDEDNEANQTTELEHLKSIDSSTSNQNDAVNIPTLLSTPQKGHRRKFSLGNSISGVTGSVNSRKVNDKLTLSTQFNQANSPDSHIPTTPAPANLTIRGASDDSSESLTYDEPVGASDMLVSSRVEQQQRTNNISSKSVKTPLKFEIHIVKVPLVGLYGIQFKKVSGNTWLYKSLASEILSRLNL